MLLHELKYLVGEKVKELYRENHRDVISFRSKKSYILITGTQLDTKRSYF